MDPIWSYHSAKPLILLNIIHFPHNWVFYLFLVFRKTCFRKKIRKFPCLKFTSSGIFQWGGLLRIYQGVYCGRDIVLASGSPESSRPAWRWSFARRGRGGSASRVESRIPPEHSHHTTQNATKSIEKGKKRVSKIYFQ